MHRPPRTLARRLLGTGLAAAVGVTLIGGLAPSAHALVTSTTTITISPAAATHPTGTRHFSSVTVTSSDGTTTTPVVGARVFTFATGPDGVRGAGAPTDANGQVLGLALDSTQPGVDTIKACLDGNANNVCDPTELISAPATVTWTQNRAPTADDQTVVTGQRRATLITLTGADPDGTPITFDPVTSPLHGTLTDTPAGLVYTPDAGYTGPDSFDFVSDDGTLQSDPATVSIVVRHDATLQVRQEHRPRITVNSLLKTLVPDPSSNRPRKILVLSDDGQNPLQLVLNRTESGDHGDSRRTRYVGTLSFVRDGKVVKLPVKATWNPVTKTVSGEWDRRRDEGKFTLVIDPAPMASGALRAS